MPKLLIWSKNTNKQKKKPEWEGEGRSMEYVESERERSIDITDLLPPPFRSIFLRSEVKEQLLPIN
jgi:hypothetical protein